MSGLERRGVLVLSVVMLKVEGRKARTAGEFFDTDKDRDWHRGQRQRVLGVRMLAVVYLSSMIPYIRCISRGHAA